MESSINNDFFIFIISLCWRCISQYTRIYSDNMYSFQHILFSILHLQNGQALPMSMDSSSATMCLRQPLPDMNCCEYARARIDLQACALIQDDSHGHFIDQPYRSDQSGRKQVFVLKMGPFPGNKGLTAGGWPGCSLYNPFGNIFKA